MGLFPENPMSGEAWTNVLNGLRAQADHYNTERVKQYQGDVAQYVSDWKAQGAKPSRMPPAPALKQWVGADGVIMIGPDLVCAPIPIVEPKFDSGTGAIAAQGLPSNDQWFAVILSKLNSIEAALRAKG